MLQFDSPTLILQAGSRARVTAGHRSPQSIAHRDEQPRLPIRLDRAPRHPLEGHQIMEPLHTTLHPDAGMVGTCQLGVNHEGVLTHILWHHLKERLLTTVTLKDDDLIRGRETVSMFRHPTFLGQGESKCFKVQTPYHSGQGESKGFKPFCGSDPLSFLHTVFLFTEA